MNTPNLLLQNSMLSLSAYEEQLTDKQKQNVMQNLEVAMDAQAEANQMLGPEIAAMVAQDET